MNRVPSKEKLLEAVDGSAAAEVFLRRREPHAFLKASPRCVESRCTRAFATCTFRRSWWRLTNTQKPPPETATFSGTSRTRRVVVGKETPLDRTLWTDLNFETSDAWKLKRGASQRTLKSLAPQFKWTGPGNLLGDYGEFIATEVYGLSPAPRGAKGYDAIREDVKKVQVKTNFAASQIGFRGEADLVLCLRNRPKRRLDGGLLRRLSVIKKVARYSARDNKSMVALTVLKKIKDAEYELPTSIPATPITLTRENEPI